MAACAGECLRILNARVKLPRRGPSREGSRAWGSNQNAVLVCSSLPGRAKLGYVTEERAVPTGAERGSDAIMAFLGAGLVQRPSRAQAVDALAAARRGVASCQAHGEAVASGWLMRSTDAASVRMPLSWPSWKSLISVIKRHRGMSLSIPAVVRPSKTCWLSSA